jgi:hypothetical protein
MIKAVTIGVLALSASVSIAWADGADPEDFFGRYFHRSDTIALGAGNAKAVNANAQIIDPWPAGIGNRRHPADGQRMTQAVQRYQDVRKIKEGAQPLAPEAISTSGPSSGGGTR